jgi:hypothetical protein
MALVLMPLSEVLHLSPAAVELVWQAQTRSAYDCQGQ